MKRSKIALAVFVVGVAGCHGKTHFSTVTYAVSGTAKTATIAYLVDASRKKVTVKSGLPWQITLNCPTNTPVFMMAEVGPGGGALHGEISIDHRNVRNCDSRGADSLAQCGAGLLP